MDTTAKGDELEVAIFEIIREKIESDRFFARSECCTVYRQKAYFSKDRGADIVFDVAIEIRNPGESEFSILYLIECKNYSRPVPIGDIESFFAKVNQVGGARTKAVVSSSNGFQESALKFSRSQGIGLIRYVGSGKMKWVLQRSPSAWSAPTTITSHDPSKITCGIVDPNFTSRCFDWYCLAPSKATNSIDHFFASLAAHNASDDISDLLAKVASSTRSTSPVVPFLEKDRIEAVASDAHRQIDYTNGKIDLDSVCRWQKKQRKLEYHVSKHVVYTASGGRLLGTFSAEPLSISIYQAQSPERQRFTLAHELGHLLLGHSDYLLSEDTEDDDLERSEAAYFGIKDVQRLEWQANYFAACLLMPKDTFSRRFIFKANQLGLRDRGFGPLYVDEQRTNLKNFYALTHDLMARFNVSRESARLRLIELGLLNDARRTPKPIQQVIDFTDPGST